MNSKVIALALSTMMLAACNSEENFPGGETNPNVARFSATIDAPATRAVGVKWEPNDLIGISGKSGSKQYTNVCYYTKDGDGNFTVKNSGEEIYYQDDNEVTFTAYYPWKALQGATTIAANTWRQAEQKDFDYLWAQAKGSKENNSVSFHFDHKMAKVNFTIKCGNDVTFDEVKAAVLSLDDFKYEGEFDVTTGDATATGNPSVMWEFANSTYITDNAPFTTDDAAKTVTYSLLLFPQEFDAELTFYAELEQQTFQTLLDFTDANRQIDGTDAENAWIAGRQYNLNIILNKTGIQVKDCTIEDWKPVDGGDFSAK